MEQPGGSLGYENQQTRSVMPRSFPPSRSSVRLYWHFHRAVRFGAARFTYIGVSTAKIWARSRNKRAEPTYYLTLLRWVTKPSERVSKTWSYTPRYSEIN